MDELDGEREAGPQALTEGSLFEVASVRRYVARVVGEAPEVGGFPVEEFGEVGLGEEQERD